jgi:hypothetical protein
MAVLAGLAMAVLAGLAMAVLAGLAMAVLAGLATAVLAGLAMAVLAGLAMAVLAGLAMAVLAGLATAVAPTTEGVDLAASQRTARRRVTATSSGSCCIRGRCPRASFSPCSWQGSGVERLAAPIYGATRV